MNIHVNAVKKLMMAIAVSLSLSAMATGTIEGGKADLSLEPSKTNATVVVRVWNLSTAAPATIQVLDKNGKVIYQEKVSGQESQLKKYDFSRLQHGKYSLVLKSETGSVTKSFVVGVDGKVREQNQALLQFKPVVFVKNNQVQVMFENKSSVALSVALFDKNGNTLYTETVAGNQSYAKAIRLEQLPAGQYTVEVKGQDYRYQKSISKF